MLKLIRFWLPPAICMGFIFYSSSVPGTDIPALFPYQDIVFHLAVYAMLAYFIARALKNTTTMKAPAVLALAVIFASVYGVSDEIHQMFVPHRAVSGFDVLTDGIGAFLGSLLHKWLI